MSPALMIAALALGLQGEAAPHDHHHDHSHAHPPADVVERMLEGLDAEHRERLQADIEQGGLYAAQVDEELERVDGDDVAKQERVDAIASRVAMVAATEPVTVIWGDERFNPFQYRFTVVRGDEVNAFSIPGGYIYVYEGLVDFSESDDELASILAHEIAHAAFRHLDELQRRRSQINSLTWPLVIALLIGGAETEGAAAAMGATLATQAFTSGWSVDAETAADYGGFQYMTRAGYNPVGALTFMERLAERKRLEPSIDWGIYQTHPITSDRVEFLYGKLEEYAVPIQRSAVTTSFAARYEPGEDGRLSLLFGDRLIHSFGGDQAIARAELAVERLNGYMDTVPQLFSLTFDSDSLFGNGIELFSVAPEDLVGTGVSVEQGREASRRAIRAAVFELGAKIEIQ